jgi:hypothetical protein
MTRSNGREVEQSVTASWRISHVYHKKGDSLDHWQVHTWFEHFVPKVVGVGSVESKIRCLTPAAGPIADPFV